MTISTINGQKRACSLFLTGSHQLRNLITQLCNKAIKMLHQSHQIRPAMILRLRKLFKLRKIIPMKLSRLDRLSRLSRPSRTNKLTRLIRVTRVSNQARHKMQLQKVIATQSRTDPSMAHSSQSRSRRIGPTLGASARPPTMPSKTLLTRSKHAEAGACSPSIWSLYSWGCTCLCTGIRCTCGQTVI